MELIEYKEMDSIENTHPWFLAKKRYLFFVIHKYLKNKEAKVLDVGCGTGAIMKAFKDEGFDIRGIDYNQTAIDYCHEKGLNATLGSLDDQQFADQSFDCVVALDVLEHIEKDDEAVRQIGRLLKPGGILVATAPAHQLLWSYHDVSLHHCRRYSYGNFKQLFADGYEIKFLGWIHAFILLPLVAVRLLRKVFKTQEQQSDVRPVSKPAALVLNFSYLIEYSFFRIFGRLPFGLSLMVAAVKK